jgi:hypothetical protein
MDHGTIWEFSILCHRFIKTEWPLRGRLEDVSWEPVFTTATGQNRTTALNILVEGEAVGDWPARHPPRGGRHGRMPSTTMFDEKRMKP